MDNLLNSINEWTGDFYSLLFSNLIIIILILLVFIIILIFVKIRRKYKSRKIKSIKVVSTNQWFNMEDFKKWKKENALKR